MLELFILLLSIVAFVWVYFVLPAGMASHRGRSPTIWVLVSVILSPLFAIFMLWLLGTSRVQGEQSGTEQKQNV